MNYHYIDYMIKERQKLLREESRKRTIARWCRKHRKDSAHKPVSPQCPYLPQFLLKKWIINALG